MIGLRKVEEEVTDWIQANPQCTINEVVKALHISPHMIYRLMAMGVISLAVNPDYRKD